MVLELNKYYTDGDVYVKLTNLEISDSHTICGIGFRLSTQMFVTSNKFGVRNVRNMTLEEERWLDRCISEGKFLQQNEQSNYEIY